MIRWLNGAVACGLLIVAGCGKSQYPVTGHVTFKDGRDASVLKGGTVSLEPEDVDKLLSSCQGTIRDDGSFTIGTTTDDDGAAPGKYIVLIWPPSPPGQKEKRIRERAKEPTKVRPLINLKYGSVDKTPHRINVEAKNNVLELAVD